MDAVSPKLFSSEESDITHRENIYVEVVPHRIRFEIGKKLAAIHFAKNCQNLSLHSYYMASVAERLARSTVNRKIGGSNPPRDANVFSCFYTNLQLPSSLSIFVINLTTMRRNNINKDFICIKRVRPSIISSVRSSKTL